MNGQPAIILMEHELQHILKETARIAAQEVIATFREDLSADPNKVVIRKLRAYIQDRSTISNPRDMWANSLHIRSIKLNSRHQPRSLSWFHKFKVRTGLAHCYGRPSAMSGGQTEWCFEDVANAWEA